MVYTTFFVALEWFPSYLLKLNESILVDPMPHPCFFFKRFSRSQNQLSPTKIHTGKVPVGESNLTVPVETHRGNYSHFMIYTRSSSSAGRRREINPGVQGLLLSPPPTAGEFSGFHSRPDFQGIYRESNGGEYLLVGLVD